MSDGVAKGPHAYRTISEAAELVGVAPHVLRFWEANFSFIKPMKRAGGRRFYSPRDLAVLSEVRRLLHVEAYTIKGVRKLHRQGGLRTGAARSADEEPSSSARLESLLEDLETAKRRLESLMAVMG